MIKSTIMGANNNKKKHATLGMPHGTAVSRLRKRIMLHLLQKLNEDCCFKCGEKIETTDDLSIEHIKPWEGISADLFWDLNNISFSHLRCNRPHHHNGGGQYLRKITPEGAAWCGHCKKFEPIENFYSESRRWNGLRWCCKKYRF